MLSPTDRMTYITNHLKMIKNDDGRDKTGRELTLPDEDKKKREKFVNEYLRQDGIFLLRLIGHNTNTMTVTEIVKSLWSLWEKHDNKQNDIAGISDHSDESKGLLKN